LKVEKIEEVVMSSANSEMITEPKVHKWTRDELLKMWAMGLLRGQRVELIEGEVIELNPISSMHATAVTLATYTLREIFGKGWIVRVQNPLSLGVHSEPHPDIAVVAGEARVFKDEHPNTGTLIVEVADSSLAYDRHRKAAVYAEGNIPEYWIINLQERLLEVYRHPITRARKVILRVDRNSELESAARNALDPFNPRPVEHKSGPESIYTDTLILTEDQSISPLARPEAHIAVADLLP